MSVVMEGNFHFFEGRTKAFFEFIKESGLKGVAQKGKVKVRFSAPGTGRTNTTFGNKAMNVGVPFEISAKGMKNTNKARSKRFRKVIFMKHSKNTASDGRKKAVKQGTVFQKKVPINISDFGKKVLVPLGLLPKTGDGSISYAPLLALMAASGLLIFGLVWRRIRKAY